MNYEEYINIINLYRDKEVTREEFNNRILEITNTLTSPLKEFYVINSYFGNYYVPKDYRNYLYSNSLAILESDKIHIEDKNKIKCALINAYFSDCNYEMAETYANDLLSEFSNDVKILKDLASYYTKTRRYNLAENLYKNIINLNQNDIIMNDYESFQRVINRKQKPYLPLSEENREKYYEFMNYLGIQVEKRKKQPEKIKIDDYPVPIEHLEADFDSFVAFDVETTGIDHTMDSITEIAAIKVVNGQIVEEKEFLFQELVHPYKKRIPKNVEELTCITNEMVKDAKRIWEVFPKFVNFVGNNILLGYNCMTFDSKFLVRARRLSNLVINNEYFDVLHMARKHKEQIDSKSMTLVQVGKTLGIENSQAHRALADAITTAKIYLSLKKLK